jgi:hypothetical protein
MKSQIYDTDCMLEQYNWRILLVGFNGCWDLKPKLWSKCRGKLWKHGTLICMAQIGSSYSIIFVFTCIILKNIILHYINRILTYIIYIYSFYDINMEYILVSLVSLYINTILHSTNINKQYNLYFNCILYVTCVFRIVSNLCMLYTLFLKLVGPMW